ncbi:DUF4407 domain-containing protein [Saccharothrix yanglingensis]|uniref:DUF4407 domain-containing protein n=1 Tax=Saccharothrix yanglingensis TaxID=659496 RepID=UPI0027D222EF|nr:DUF4407 domain-containing protein [Saccharothrix yanglingensis]
MSRPHRLLLPLWWLGNGFAWLGGASWRGLTSRYDRSSYQVSGFFVLLNGVIAWGLVTLAAVGMELVPSFADAAPFTIVWGLFVLLFDRAIAAKVVDPGEDKLRSRSSYVVRVICAVLIGFIVAELGALAIFHEDVERTMGNTTAKQVEEARRLVVGADGAPSERQAKLEGLEADRAALDTRVADAQKAFDDASRLAACELDPRGCDDLLAQGRITGRAGEGDKTALLNQERDAARTALESATAERSKQAPGLDRDISDLRTAVNTDLDEAQRSAESAKSVPARWRAMLEFTTKDPNGRLMHLMLIVFGILLDMIPLLIKMWRGQTDYDRTVVAHRTRHAYDVRSAQERHAAELAHAGDRHLGELQRAAARERLHGDLELELVKLRGDTTRKIEVEKERVRFEQAVEELREKPVVPEAVREQPLTVLDRRSATTSSVRLPRSWAEQDQALVGHVFGGLYRAVEPLEGADRGGFGRMLRGKDTKTGRQVVIKAVRDTDGDDGSRSPLGEMWQREVDAAQKLAHGNIGKIITSGLDKGHLWTASPLYQPGSLVKWIETTTDQDPAGYTLQHSINYMKQLVDALVYAHERNVTHGDIKPTNAVLHGPTLKLVDWGFARLSSRLEEGAAVLHGGTPLYTAPEALLGGDFDAQLADVYSVGATWYYLLTGHPPYQDADLDGSARDVARQIREKQVVCHRVEQYLPDVPGTVADLVHDLVRTYPGTRVGSTGGDSPAAHLHRAMTVLAADPETTRKGDMPVGPGAGMRHKGGVDQPDTRPDAPAPGVSFTYTDVIPSTRAPMTSPVILPPTVLEHPVTNGMSTLLEDDN